MVVVVVDKWEEQLRQDIARYKRSIALIFDIHLTFTLLHHKKLSGKDD